MKKIKNVKNILLIALIILLIILGFFGVRKFSVDKNITLLSTNIEEKVSRLIELSTIKYNYTNVVEYDNKMQVNGMNIPFTNKKFILKYSGYIKAGIDLTTIDVKVKDKDTINVKMDKAEIFENVISEEDVYFYDERDSVFNKLSFKDLYSVLIEEKEKMKEEVMEKGILNDAQENGLEIIYSLLEGMGFKNIKIEYK